MTKEELEKEAEEWLCNNLHSASEEDFIKAMVDIAEPREKRIAELKVGRPNWHKVADGDLPKETGEYLTNIGVLIWDYYGDGRYGWHTEICEHCECMDDVDSDEVVAWCEIPKYKGE